MSKSSSPPPTIRKVHTGRGGAGNTILIASNPTSSSSSVSPSQKSRSFSSSSILKYSPRSSLSSTTSSPLTVPASAVQKTASTGRGGAGNIRPMYSIISDGDGMATRNGSLAMDEKRVTGRETAVGEVAWSRDDESLQFAEREQEQRRRRRHVGRGGAGNRCVVEKEGEGVGLARKRLVGWGL